MPAKLELASYNILGYVGIKGASFFEKNPSPTNSVEFPAVGFEPDNVPDPHTAYVPIERGDPRIRQWVPETRIETSKVTGRQEYVLHLNGIAQRVR